MLELPTNHHTYCAAAQSQEHTKPALLVSHPSRPAHTLPAALSRLTSGACQRGNAALARSFLSVSLAASFLHTLAVQSIVSSTRITKNGPTCGTQHASGCAAVCASALTLGSRCSDNAPAGATLRSQDCTCALHTDRVTCCHARHQALSCTTSVELHNYPRTPAPQTAGSAQTRTVRHG